MLQYPSRSVAFGFVGPQHRRLRVSLRASTALAVALTLGLTTQTFGQTWDGGTDTDWTLGTNWNPNTAPTPAQTATIAGAGGANQPTLGAGDAVTVAQTNVSGGTLTVGGNLTSPVTVSAAGSVTVSGTGQLIGAVSSAGTLANSGTITGSLAVTGGSASSSGTVTGAATVSGGALSVTGPGTLGSNSVSVSAGTLTTDSDALAAGANVTVSGSGTFTSSGADTYTGITQTGGTVNGTGVETLTGAFAQSGGTTGGSVDINAATFTQSGGATVAAGTTVTSAGAQTLQGGTIAGTLDGAGAVTVNTGTTSLTGTGAITNAAIVGIAVGGTLISDGQGITDTATVDNNGTLTITGAETIGGLRGNGTTNLTGATLTTGNAFINTFGGTMQGTGGLAVQGVNITALAGTNTFSGGTTVTSGTLSLANNASNLSDTGLVTVNAPGTLQLVGDETIGAVQGGGAVDIFSGTLTTGGVGDTNLSGNITGAGTLVKQGTGTFTVSGAVATDTTVNAGTLTLSGANTMASITVDEGRLRLLSNGAAGGAAGQITTTGSVISYGNGVTMATPITLNSNDTQLEVLAADSATQSGVISESGGARPVEKIGTGTLTFTGANTYTGTTTVSAGTLVLNNGVGGGAIANTGAVSVSSGGTLRVDAAETVGSLAGAGNTMLNADLTTGGNGGSTTVSGVISGAAGNDLTKVGAGTLTLSGTNTYAGDTTVNGGTLAVTSGAAIADAGNVIVGNGGTFTVSTNTEDIGNLSSSDTATSTAIVNVNAGLVILGAANTIFDGNIAGAGQLTYRGTGSLALTGTNAITGLVVSSGAGGGGDIAITGAGTVATQNVLAIDGGTISTDGGAFASNANLIVDGATSTATLTGSETIGAVLGNSGADMTGTLNLTGAGTVLTLNGSSFDSDIAGAVAGVGRLSVTGGTTTVAAAGDVQTSTTIGGTGTIDSEGTLAAVTVQSGGTLLAQGTMTGPLVNQLGGTATLDGDLAFTGAAAADRNVTNGGALSVTGVGTDVTGINALANQPSGTLSIASGAGLTAVTILNQGSAAAPTGTITSLGTITATTGFTNTQFGVVNAQGALNADVANAGTFNVTGRLTASGAARDFANAASGILSVTGGSYTGLDAITNAGTVNVGTGRTLGGGGYGNTGTTNLSGTIAAPVTNGGTIAVIGTGAITGNTINTGTIDLDTVGSGTADRLNITGDLAGNGSFRVRSDVTQVVGSADRIAVSGAASGNYVFQFSNVGPAVLGDDLLIFDAGSSGGYTFAAAGLIGGGAVVTTFEQVGNDLFQVRQASSGIGGIAAGTTLTQSLIGTVVNRPTSPFVSGLASEETCSQGGYARATGGIATVEGSSNNGATTTQSSVDARYGGFQAGYDFGCNDGRYGGWDANFGALVGYNFGSTDQNVFGSANPALVTSITKTDFDQTYVGLYAAASKDRLSGDVQLRFENTKYELDEETVGGSGLGLGSGVLDPLGLIDNSYSANSTTISTRVNYRLDLNDDGLGFVPTVGFAYTKTRKATLAFDGGETLAINDSESLIGFIGGTLTKTIVSEAGDAGTTYFASGNYYNDFAGDRTSVFTDTALTETVITTEGLGGFAEASIGVNYVKILENGPGGAKQLNANLRADARFGANVKDSYSLTAQVRFSF